MAQSTSPGAGSAPVSDHQTASSIQLSWSAPALSTGLDATGYRVYDVSSESSVLVYDGAESSSVEALISGLESGRLYSYVVSALSGAGEGDVSASTDISTAPGVISSLVSVHQTSSSITLSWEAPSVSTGSAVSGYKVYERVVHNSTAVSDVFESAGVSEDVVEHFLDPSEMNMVIDTLVYDGSLNVATLADLTSLNAGVMYSYVATAVSAAGEGDKSESISTSTSPSTPANLHVSSQSASSVGLAWDASLSTTGAPVTGYVLYRNDGLAGLSVSTIGYDGSASLSTTGTVQGLVGGRVYTFSVTAISKSGESSRIALQVPTSPAAVGSIESLAQTSSTISLSWVTPDGDGGDATGYVVYRNDG
eukprot:SAG11_NODE_4875_length_1736_cov_8.597315_2_plen_363_part_01